MKRTAQSFQSFVHATIERRFDEGAEYNGGGGVGGCVADGVRGGQGWRRLGTGTQQDTNCDTDCTQGNHANRNTDERINSGVDAKRNGDGCTLSDQDGSFHANIHSE